MLVNLDRSCQHTIYAMRCVCDRKLVHAVPLQCSCASVWILACATQRSLQGRCIRTPNPYHTSQRVDALSQQQTQLTQLDRGAKLCMRIASVCARQVLYCFDWRLGFGLSEHRRR